MAARVPYLILDFFCVELFNSSPHGQNGHHFADNIFRCIFVNETICILIQISLKFVPKGLIDNMWALVQVVAWHLTCHKPLPESMMTQFTDAYMRHSGEMRSKKSEFVLTVYINSWHLILCDRVSNSNHFIIRMHILLFMWKVLQTFEEKNVDI